MGWEAAIPRGPCLDVQGPEEWDTVYVQVGPSPTAPASHL